MDGLYGSGQSLQSLNYKQATIRALNQVLKDPTEASSDETISAVFLLGSILVIRFPHLVHFLFPSLTFLQTQLGEPKEVTAHLNGIQTLIDLRGGIDNFKIEGCFLHMTCT